MRRVLVSFVLLTACADSHVIGDFDSGPRRDAASVDAPSFDAPRFDAPSFDAPRADVSARDAGPARVDAGPILDGGRDATGITDECDAFCERADMCIADVEPGCVEGCYGLAEFIVDPGCALLAYSMFRCAEGVSCEGFEEVFDGPCRTEIDEFGARCGEL